MYNYKCPFAEHRKEGFKVWLQCTISNDVCPFIRFCREKRDVEHTTTAPNCRLFTEYKSEVKNDNS